ncbi:signal peptidase I [Chloroflexota bacterium]
MKKVAWYLVCTTVVLFMAVAVFIYTAPHIGWRVDAVLSGSMEPELRVGSLVVTSPVEPEAIVVGDIITFRPVSVGENLITHRVIRTGQSSSLYFETKGDAADKPDPFTVPAQNLVGKVCFHVSYWGFFTEFLKTPFGFMFAIIIPGIFFITMYIVSILRVLANGSNRKKIDECSNE